MTPDTEEEKPLTRAGIASVVTEIADILWRYPSSTRTLIQQGVRRELDLRLYEEDPD